VSTNNSISQVAEPTDAGNFTSFQWNFLVLPTGQIMALETDGWNVWTYTPSGLANAAWRPTVSAAPASLVSGGTFTLSGNQLNGLSQGASYGDDVQAASNYPIIEIVSLATGHLWTQLQFQHDDGRARRGRIGILYHSRKCGAWPQFALCHCERYSLRAGQPRTERL
jgi:hypothetical protein